MRFVVKGRHTASGKMVTGVIEAPSAQDATSRATMNGIEVTSVTLQEIPGTAGGAPGPAPASVVRAPTPVAAPYPADPVPADDPWQGAPGPPPQSGGAGLKFALLGCMGVIFFLLFIGVGIALYFAFFSSPAGIDGRRLLPDCTDAKEVMIANMDVAAIMKTSVGNDLRANFKNSGDMDQLPFKNVDLDNIQDVTLAVYQPAGETQDHTFAVVRLKTDQVFADFLKYPAGDKQTYNGVDYQGYSETEPSQPPPWAASGPAITPDNIHNWVAKLASKTFLLCDREQDIKDAIDRYKSGKKAAMPAAYDEARKYVKSGQVMLAGTINETDAPNAVAFSATADAKINVEGTLIFDSADEAAAFNKDAQSNMRDAIRKLVTFTQDGNLVKYTGTGTVDDLNKIGGGRFLPF